MIPVYQICSDSQFFYFTERFGREIIKLTTPIGFQAAVVNAVLLLLPKGG